MRKHIHPAAIHFTQFIEHLPELFDHEGQLLYERRNKIKCFTIEGVKMVVKRYKRPNLFQAIVYTFFRKSKAQRAYEHAIRLREMGFDTPAPIGWSEYFRHGLLSDSYLITWHTSDTALTQAARNWPSEEAIPILNAFVRFTIRLHEAGIEHCDFNHSNILYKYDIKANNYRFQLIDINRMRFHKQHLNMRRCMINLRRLSVSGEVFLYLLNRYAEERKWLLEETLLQGVIYRLLFLRRQRLKKQFREHKTKISAKK